jgi:hypothetical protein
VLKQLMLSVTIAAVPIAGLAQGNEPETLKRTGKWVVDYDNDACHLAAQFGTGDDMMIMSLTRYQPGDWFDLSLHGRKLVSTEARREVKVDFGLGGPIVEADAVNGKAGDLPLILFGTTRLDGWKRTTPGEIAPLLSPQQEAAVSGVTVMIKRKKPFRLEFGSLAKPMEQLRTCQADLLQSWGYDPAVQATLAKPTRPVNSPAKWLSPDDYPQGAISVGHNGIVQFRLDVEADGSISGCHVLARTRPDVFADTTCRAVTRRAKLEPALGADGKPVRSFFVQKVHWQVTN